LSDYTPKTLVTVVLINPLKESVQISYGSPLGAFTPEKVWRARIVIPSMKSMIVRKLHFNLQVHNFSVDKP
jgi:hypothetical protein